MADLKKTVPDNIAGNFFVDTTCINCDTCRQLAPETFADQGDYSYVFSQPKDQEKVRAATRALLCCPTGSIGTRTHNDAAIVANDLPLLIEDDVFYCGFNSPKSYGGNSFVICHPEGNWLIDSPKYLPHLIEKFEKMGGIKYLFLTHRDDVAEASKYATKFGAERIIHRFELSAQPEAEIVIDALKPVPFANDFLILPVPGHTRGHMVLIYKSKFLFSGDHLSFDTHTDDLHASNSYCWYSWAEQIKSMEKLADYDFEWVLAGHGDRTKMSRALMHKKIAELVERMKRLES